MLSDGANEMQETVQVNWTHLSRLLLNPTKCKEVRISFVKRPLVYVPLNVNNQLF